MNADAVWDALARALAGEYEIVVRLGLGPGGAPVYLAREMVTDNMVALRLPPLVSDAGAQEYGLEVVRQIDASLPAIETTCSNCGASLREWSAFCPRCGHGVSGIAPSPTGQTRKELRALVQRAATWKYEIVGEMPRAEGGGVVYFGRDLEAGGTVVGLRLEAGAGESMRLIPTRFAAHDPTIELAESRQPSGKQIARRVSVPLDVTTAPSAPRRKLAAGALGMMSPLTIAIVALVILALIAIVMLL